MSQYRIMNSLLTTNITISLASIDDYPTIQNMGRFYVYDISEYMGDETGWEMPENGLYECIDFKKYWEDKNSYPHLIRHHSELAGFVIVDKKGSDTSIEFNMAQFFILRKFKNKGIGRYVANYCFDHYRGTWEIMVMPRNTGAYNFWKKVISGYTNDYSEYTRTVAHLNNCTKNIFKFNSNRLTKS